MNITMIPSPNKTSDNTSTESPYSPILLPENPANAATHRNITGLPRVARDIAADIYNNIQKWNGNHIKGSNIIKEIGTSKINSTELFPSNLEDYMKKLFDIVQNLSIYSNALIFLSGQMSALVKLHKQPLPLFVSLTVEQLADLVKEISDAYKVEFKVKQYVLENIAHSKTKQEIMFFASSWANQCNVTNMINLKLETLLTETGHRKIS